MYDPQKIDPALHNGGCTVTATDHSNAIVGNNFYFITADRVIQRITDAVMMSDLSPEMKCKVWAIIKNASNEGER